MNHGSPKAAATRAGGLRSKLREVTNAAIIDAAEAVFADKGLHTAAMNDIAQAAGVSVGTLYNHFTDRDAILSELVIKRRDFMLAQLDEFIAKPTSGHFSDDLTKLVYVLSEFLDAHGRFYHILHQCEMGIDIGAFPKVAVLFTQTKDMIHTRLKKIVARGIKLGALRPEGSECYPALLMGVLRARRLQQQKQRELMSIEDAVRFFIHGAGTQSAKTRSAKK